MAREVGPDGFLTQQALILNRPGSFADLSRYRLPTLVLCGREDILMPVRLHENMAAELPNGRLRVLERCGHLSPLEQPRAVTAALRRWLS
jgi:pimeloyl-ACP methyl ester carboxylesterase